MNNNIAIFLDIDGTLYSHKTYGVPKSTVDILKELYDKGSYDLYISTGRSIHSLDIVKDVMPFMKGVSCTNAGQIRIDNEDVFLDYIDRKTMENLFIDLDKLQISFGVLSNGTEYRCYYDDKVKEEFESKVKTPYKYTNEDDLWKDTCIQIWLLAENEKLDKIALLHPEFSVFKWGAFGADCVPVLRDKGTGIKKIIKYMDYDISNCYAFGDSDNDLAMFKEVGTSIAMGNGNENAKSLATFITETIDNDGLAKGINEIILNKK